MLKIILKTCIICSIIISQTALAKKSKTKLEQINVIFELSQPSLKDKKLDKVLNNLNKILKDKLNLKIKSSRRAYLESEGKNYLTKSLKSIGYYKVEVVVKEVNEVTSSKSAINDITFQISPGPKFLVSNIAVKITDNSYTPKVMLNLPSITWYAISPGDFAIAKNIIQEEGRLQQYIEDNNFVLNVDVKHEATVDLEKNTVEIIFEVTTGQIAFIKHISFSGLKTIDETYARKLVPIKNKEGFKISKVDEAKISLQQSGLFRLVEPLIPLNSQQEKEIELQFKVKERKHRTVKAGLNYSSDLGSGVILGWEHRNLYSQGEKIDLSLIRSKKDKALNANFEKPFFLNDKQTLKIATAIAKNKSLAYTSEEISLATTIERVISKNWIGGITTKYSDSIIEDSDNNRSKFKLFSLPVYGTFDSRDDILNPQKGLLIHAQGIPFIDIKNKNKFSKYTISASGYIDFATKFDSVIAVRVAAGKITTAKVKDIVANERFYIGGGGSVRGYGYQLVGPLTNKDRPIGGNRFIEKSLELRTKFTKKIGVAIFADGGNVYNPDIKNISKLLFSTGMGVRYYTDFGPIRADIAFPTKRRKSMLNPGKKLDKAFQVYFSIGQAF
ncbi:MAG: hypothetical protein EOP33_01815 [Rickettsiaceae bacterium]|nr:MAG: hypothetical protein EOP33_01815 [Rickettsiaceae bacterium]